MSIDTAPRRDFLKLSLLTAGLALGTQGVAGAAEPTVKLGASPLTQPPLPFAESALEPINRNGKLIFNEKLKGNPHMVNMEAQFLALSPTSRAHDDGPDAVEGAKYILDSKTMSDPSLITVKKYAVNPKRY